MAINQYDGFRTDTRSRKPPEEKAGPFQAETNPAGGGTASGPRRRRRRRRRRIFQKVPWLGRLWDRMERLGERICSQPWVGALKDWFCSPSWVDVVCAPLTLWIVRWYVRNFEIANFCLYFTYSPGLNILLVMGMLLPIVVYIMRVFHL